VRGARELWPATFQQWIYNEVRSARNMFWNALLSDDPEKLLVARDLMLEQANNCIRMELCPPTTCSFEEAEELTSEWLVYVDVWKK
jgi:hypothetical protein